MGTTLSQRDVNNGHVVYIHDHSDINNDSVIYALGLIYGPQLELGIQPQNRWYFSQVVQLPVRVDQVLTFYADSIAIWSKSDDSDRCIKRSKRFR